MGAMETDGMRIDTDALAALADLTRALDDEDVSDYQFRDRAREALSSLRVQLAPPDLTVEYETAAGPFGPSVYLLRPQSERGNRWITEHVGDDALFFGSALVVEHRYIEQITDGAIDDGLRVERRLI